MKKTATLIKTKYKQQDIAEKLGVSQPTVSNWLGKRAKPMGLAKKALEEHYPDLAREIEAVWKN